MAYTTVALVKELGGLNSADDYNLFRFTTPDELDAAITRKIAAVSSWLKSRNASQYATTDTDEQAVITEGETALVMHYLTLPLKSRKVFGTHWPLDQEGSDRFAELIDVEYLKIAQEWLGEFFTVTETPSGFALPFFGVNITRRVSTDLTRLSQTQITQELDDLARGQVDHTGLVVQS